MQLIEVTGLNRAVLIVHYMLKGGYGQRMDTTDREGVNRDQVYSVTPSPL